MNILVVNAGSSSLKYQLIDTDTNVVSAKGICERIGGEGSVIQHKQLIKDIVDKVDNALIAAEIIRHKYRSLGIVSDRAERGIALLHIGEYLRICASELVYALLYITDHEAIGIRGDSLEYLIL